MIKALISAAINPLYQSTFHATKSIIFFGTPHRGAAALRSTRITLLKKVAKIAYTRIPANLERALELRAEELFRVNDSFRNLSTIRDRTVALTCFYERKETLALGDVVSTRFLSRYIRLLKTTGILTK